MWKRAEREKRLNTITSLNFTAVFSFISVFYLSTNDYSKWEIFHFFAIELNFNGNEWTILHQPHQIEPNSGVKANGNGRENSLFKLNEFRCDALCRHFSLASAHNSNISAILVQFLFNSLGDETKSTDRSGTTAHRFEFFGSI